MRLLAGINEVGEARKEEEHTLLTETWRGEGGGLLALQNKRPPPSTSFISI